VQSEKTKGPCSTWKTSGNSSTGWDYLRKQRAAEKSEREKKPRDFWGTHFLFGGSVSEEDAKRLAVYGGEAG